MSPGTGVIAGVLLVAVGVTIGTGGPAAPARAAEIDHARQYETCMVLVQRNPEEAFESALAWRDMGGGDAARHCVAAALAGLKQFAEAGQRFERLAQEIKGKPEFSALLLGQAAQAWLLDGKPERAEAALTAALKLTPEAPDLLIDRAAARAGMAEYWDTVDDLNRAIELDPGRVDALVFRASAYRFLDSLELAEVDLEAAIARDGDHAEALLERGMVRRLKGDEDGARRDWLKVLSVAPGTPAAAGAQRNLELMDVKVR
jgi:tetratricopeptide (TPR) repeat protein